MLRRMMPGLGVFLFALLPIIAAENQTPQAARSVHLWYAAPPGNVFYNELTVEESTSASYFMACGFNHGYFGMQELMPGEDKVVLFSVWDPGEQNDPNSVAVARRVEVLYQAADVRVGRFGGEGTGAQCFFKYAWKNGETCRFLVHATTNANQTAYAAWIYLSQRREWKHLATFQTITKGEPLKGYYSFIEDFRRDGKSPHERRRARFGNGWVRTVGGEWLELTKATFTADRTPLDNIDAGEQESAFYLATGGNVTQSRELKSSISRAAVGARPSQLLKFEELLTPSAASEPAKPSGVTK